MDRKKLAELYTMELPFEPTARELLVKNITVSAVKPKSTGRPSVEALLHDSLNAKYVVHTHLAIVNGMTCAAAGKHAFRRLFPDALWVEYTDPGYTLCIKVREEIRNYEHSKGFHPNVIFLENHGLLVGHNSPEDVKAEVAWAMDLCRDKASLVYFTSNTLVPDIPLENIKTLWGTVLESRW